MNSDKPTAYQAPWAVVSFIVIFVLQDRKASEKQKEMERVKEKQQKELTKQKQIEKVHFPTFSYFSCYFCCVSFLFSFVAL